MKVDKAVKMAFSNFFFSKLWNPEFFSRSRLNRFRSKSSEFEKENSKKNRKSAINTFIPYMTSCKEASHSLDLIQFKKGWKISCGRGTASWTEIDFHCFKTSFFEKRKPFLEKEKERFSANSFLPWIVSGAKIQFIRYKIEICSNYLNFLQFPNSKKNSFCGIYMRKYCIW